MTKTILDTRGFYEEELRGAYLQLLEEWAEDQDRFDEPEDMDDTAYSWANDMNTESIHMERDYIQEELDRFIKRYEKRYGTSINTLLFVGSRYSHYGAIGGNGASLGGTADDLRDLFRQLCPDDYSIEVSEENTLVINTGDHDGTNRFEMVLITENEAERAENAWEDIRDMFRDKKPTKLDKAFRAVFGA